MSAPICTDCPPVAKLRRLIDGTIPGDEQSSITNHLDCCESCQNAIEHLAAGGSGLLDCACDNNQFQPDRQSAYWPALRKLERDMAKVSNGNLAVTRSLDEGAVALEIEPSMDFLDPAEHAGTIGKLGRFHVVEILGRGGMGVVLRAKDVCLQREVALKVLDPQYAKNELARNRFLREARAAASISHENVVAVHHVEKHREEIPFLVMRLITGQSLQDRLDAAGGPLQIRDILQIGRQTAAGLAAAHEQMLIHRDIKPANILLESGTGKVLLTDFGLARAVEDAKLTQTGFVAGTPLYMSPEQARGEILDSRSDLFSLGSVLYAMCTGNPPFQGSSPFVVLREVTEGRQKPVRDINPKIPEELVAIIDLLLAKKPEDRIQTAAEVVDLLDSALARVPVTPGDASQPKRASRILPRLRGSRWHRYGSALAVVLLILNGLLLFTELTRLTHWTVLGQRTPEAPQPKFVFDPHNGPIWSVAFSPDGSTVAMGIDDGSVRLYDAQSSKLKSSFKAQDGPVWSVIYNFDGTQIATIGDDARIRLWNPATSLEIDSIKLPSSVRSVAFSPDGKRIVAGTRQGDVRIYNIKDGKLLMTATGHKGAVMSVAWSPNGNRIASGGSDQMVRIWDVSGKDCKEVVTLTGHAGGVYAVAFDPSRDVVASGGWDGVIRLWDLDTGKEIMKLEGHHEDIWSIAFCHSGKVLASGSEDRSVKVWDPISGKQLHTVNGHVGTVYSVALAPDGKALATASRDGTVKLWATGK